MNEVNHLKGLFFYILQRLNLLLSRIKGVLFSNEVDKHHKVVIVFEEIQNVMTNISRIQVKLLYQKLQTDLQLLDRLVLECLLVNHVTD